MRLPYSSSASDTESVSLLPYIPITLTLAGQTLTAPGLTDTGASVNVLPYALGIQLGADWDTLPGNFTLSGNLAQYPARPLVLTARIGDYAPVRLAFAWTRADTVPLLLGQINFLMEFDACFYRARRVFDIQPKQI